jgi:hypothetical protein
MKKECAYTRKHLARYLAGRLFALQRRRVERHLASCVVCSSEFDAIRRIDETQRLLRDIAPAEGFARTLQAGTASVSALKRLLYRPLWLVLIFAAAAAAYFYVINPLLHDPDLERLDAPALPSADPAARLPQSAPSTTPAVEPKKSAPVASPSPAQSPLVITITVEKEKEKANLRRINEAMNEHALLRTMRFSDTTREISGSLTAGELYTFFNRIDGAGKVAYRRSRLAKAGEGELVPFVMRLQTVAAPSRPSGEQSPGQPVDKPVEKPAEKPAVPADQGTSPASSPGQ